MRRREIGGTLNFSGRIFLSSMNVTRGGYGFNLRALDAGDGSCRCVLLRALDGIAGIAFCRGRCGIALQQMQAGDGGRRSGRTAGDMIGNTIGFEFGSIAGLANLDAPLDAGERKGRDHARG